MCLSYLSIYIYIFNVWYIYMIYCFWPLILITLFHKTSLKVESRIYGRPTKPPANQSPTKPSVWWNDVLVSSSMVHKLHRCWGVPTDTVDWWFRNPKANHRLDGCRTPTVKNGISTTSSSSGCLLGFFHQRETKIPWNKKTTEHEQVWPENQWKMKFPLTQSGKMRGGNKP